METELKILLFIFLAAFCLFEILPEKWIESLINFIAFGKWKQSPTQETKE